jgi:mannitol operon repressor
MSDTLESYAIARDEIWEKDPRYRALLATLKQLNSETDRGVALVVTSLIDKLLGDALAAFLINNDSAHALLVGFNAPLGTLSTKIAACHALGIIADDEMRECHLLRRVRNAFAHEIEVTFDKGSVKDLCSNLSLPPADQYGAVKWRFIKAAMLLLMHLVARPYDVARKRLTFSEWRSRKEKAPDIPPVS